MVDFAQPIAHLHDLLHIKHNFASVVGVALRKHFGFLVAMTITSSYDVGLSYSTGHLDSKLSRCEGSFPRS